LLPVGVDRNRLHGTTKIFSRPERSQAMASKRVRAVTIGMVSGAFMLGYVFGSVSTPRASAQLPQVPGLPGQGGGALGAATQLGSSITEMEQHLSGLQKNLDVLKKLQSLLGK
jgi:hypothetical protein